MRLLWSFLALTALTATALAQWTEQGDAGDLPETAQATGTDTNTPLSSISGALSADDVDMFAIYIADPSAFHAETNTSTTNFDSQLWLFDVNGNGIVHDDDSAGSLRSRITNANNCIPGPGTYYIAISRYNRDASDCDDRVIWTSASNACAVAGRSRVASWTGTTSAGTYQIVLQGAFTSPLGADPADCPPFDGWDETANGGGDAGDLPETAQSTGSDPITKIRGTIGAANDVDVYAIYISDPSAFSATTIGGTTLDTALWLFDEDGKGVVYNDDNPDATTGTQSRIDNRTNCITQSGRYYLAVSISVRRAAGCGDGLIWATTPARGVRCPDGGESTSRVGGWSGSSSSTGRYIIFLTGVSGASAGDPADCPPPDPWDEQFYGGGDAGDLPATAQLVTLPDQTPCESPVTRVRGDNSADDVDMYVICITDPANFVASTVGTTTWDTQLWLFRCDGTGVVFNDDSSSTTQSTINNTTSCITEGGIYLLAISRYNRDAVDASGNLLWNNTPFGDVRCPDGPGAANAIAGWTGSATAGRRYTISLQGAYFV
ncbi:MAG: DVUA0089 family protein, partial [Armatimonadetes bacterium]|nr:DVUA0089 family protein [Armatimonadota bacterium]